VHTGPAPQDPAYEASATPEAFAVVGDPGVPDEIQEPAQVFRLAFTPGVTPGKWVGVWRDRLPQVPLELVAVDVLDRGAQLRGGHVNAGLLRLPVESDGMSVIPLYTEIPVVVVPKDHVIAAFDQIASADLADEVVLQPQDDLLEWIEWPGQRAEQRSATTADAIELVAAGVGVLVVPQSVARLHHRKDVTYRPVSDGPESRVGFVWVTEHMSDLIEEFIGIVRGRTVNSSRGQGSSQVAGARKTGAGSKEPTARTKAQEKAAATKVAADRRAAAARKAGARGGKLTGKRLGRRGNR
jgi:LysR substrate binding domain